jgi:hypothetical protein
MSNLLSDLKKVSGNEFACIVSEGIPHSDIVKYYDMGSYTLNAAIVDQSMVDAHQIEL